ncbi:hypothetical protein AAFF_G00306700 [Aldrovandia affinis]|uniref:Uncharacterized protein n=1 Tax=Aldrovandia affinis TaxID=143900 RepID=A0AAD7R802_9TELE|nr:hypothetical protein AAFF_G00306700 [Aldrovandia affinis]
MGRYYGVVEIQTLKPVTYTPSYKKTPPPVPPRTASKPLISVTAQSSTESTQDAYHDGRHPRGGLLWAQDGLGRALYNSTDSLDSAKAVTIAMETAAGRRHASTGSHTSVQTCDKAVLVSKAEEYLKTPRSSIGIQSNTIPHPSFLRLPKIALRIAAADESPPLGASRCPLIRIRPTPPRPSSKGPLPARRDDDK